MTRFRRYVLVAIFSLMLIRVLWAVIAPLAPIALITAALVYGGKAIYERRRW